MYRYKTSGTCSKEVLFSVDDNKVFNVTFVDGCEGNLKGICTLVEGMDIDEIISKLENIKCGRKSTSCPDQLAKALVKYKKYVSRLESVEG